MSLFLSHLVQVTGFKSLRSCMLTFLCCSVLQHSSTVLCYSVTKLKLSGVVPFPSYSISFYAYCVGTELKADLFLVA